MRTSVIVVTWNGLHVLRDCVAALAEQTLPHELIVVDNGSHDGTRPWLDQHAPHAKCIRLAYNLGFAGGNNVGLRAALGDQLVLLNNDTIAAPNFLERLVAPLADDEQIGSVAGVLTFAHQPETVASAGIVVGQDAVHRDLRALTPVAALPAQPIEIFGASGGAVCFRRAALDDVGLFDERYFNYLEDADLAWRLRLRGWRCVLAPDAHVRHIYSATAGQGSPFKQRLLARNRLRLIVRCIPYAVLRRHWLAILRYDLLAVCYALLRRQPAIIGGRTAVIRELPDLIGARRRMHKRKRVPGAELEQWLVPPVSVREMLAEQRALAAVLAKA
ncbi:MAG: glycosyltransferase family 2 protein [Chloroflexota bacterium]|nr:glycosyltransferase family 2 protein [Chloroflexota bacterium]